MLWSNGTLDAQDDHAAVPLVCTPHTTVRNEGDCSFERDNTLGLDAR